MARGLIPVNLAVVLSGSSVNAARKQMAAGLSNIPVNVNANGISQTNAQVQNLTKSLNQGRAAALGFVDTLSIKAKDAASFTILSGILYQVTGAVSNATRESIRYQAELSKIAQTIDATNESVLAQSDSLKRLSINYNVSLTKASQLTKILAQTGLSLRDATKAAELLARTSLLASFDNLTDTTEGFIAVMATFKMSVEEAAGVLESINILSKKYAVESSDLVEAISRTGGAFQAAGGRVNELLALITSVRSTTREGVETIATAFRTIFGRLQRPQTIEYFKALNIELRDLEGNFVGPFEAIKQISKGLDTMGIKAGSIEFAQAVEQIGGIRQMSKVIPLLQEMKKSQEALSLADNAGASTAMDLAKAQETVAFQLGRLQKNFQAFVSDILESETFHAFAKGMIEIANALIEVGRSLGPLMQPLKMFMTSISSLVSSAQSLSPALPVFSAIFGAKIGGALIPNLRSKGGATKQKSLLGFARGGIVPGSGNGDTVPAVLTPGEFVIRKSAVQAFGSANLSKINKYANGGKIIYDRPDENISAEVLNPGLAQSVNALAKSLNPDAKQIRGSIKNIPQYGSVVGVLFEAALSRASGGAFTNSDDPNKPFDFPYGFKNNYFNLVGKGGMTSDAKKNKPTRANILSKIARFLKSSPGQLGRGNRNFGVAIMEKGKDRVEQWSLRDLGIEQKRAKGGAIGTDTVPAMLTPGEFVINKKSAEAFGYGNLNKINRYAKGGPVEIQKFADGGSVDALNALGSLSLTDSFGPLFQAFAQLSLSTGVAVGAAESLAMALKQSRDAAIAEKKSRVENTAKIKLLEKREAELATKVRTTAKERRGVIEGIKLKGGRLDDSRYSSILSKSIRYGETEKSNPNNIAQDQANLQAAIASMKEKYGNSSAIVSGLNKIQESLKGEYGKQLAAVIEYSQTLESTTASLEEQDAVLKKKNKQQLAELQQTRTQITELKKTKKGFGSRAIEAIGGAGNIANFAVQAGITTLSAGFLAVAKNSEKAAEAAIAAGDANTAYAKTIEAIANEQKSSAMSTGAAIGAGLGAFAGPWGSAIGSMIGAAVGASGALSSFTDWLGLTNNALEQEEAARKAKLQADVTKIDQVQAKGIKSFQDAIGLDRTVEANKSKSVEASKELAKSGKEIYDRIVKSEGLNFSQPGQGADEGRQTFDMLIERFVELADRVENEGKSIDELSKKYPELVGVINEFYNSLDEGARNVKDQTFLMIEANAKRVASEATAREELVAILRRQTGSQNAFGKTLNSLDDFAYNVQNRMSGFSGYENVSGLVRSGKETMSQKASLDAVQALGPAFSEVVGRVRKIADKFGLEFNDSLINIARLPQVDRQNAIENLIKSLNLGSDSKYVQAELEKLFDKSSTREQIQQGITQIADSLKQALTGKDLESINETIASLNSSFRAQLEITNKLIEADRQVLDSRYETLQAQKDFTSRVLSLIDATPEQRFNVSRTQRLQRVRKSLTESGLPAEGKLSQEPNGSEILRKRFEEMQDQLKDLAAADKRGTNDYRKLSKESNALIMALEDLAKTADESEAIFDSVAKSMEERSQFRALGQNFAFSSSADRRGMKRTFQDAIKAANFGINAVSGERRGAVEQLLQQFKISPIFGGQTGKQILDRETVRGLSGLGFSFDQINYFMQTIAQEERTRLNQAQKMQETAIDSLNALKQIESNTSTATFFGPQVTEANQGTGIKLATMEGALFANGGSVFKPKGTDTVPAMLTPGEFVIKKSSVDKIGAANLERMNRTGTLYAADGGAVNNNYLEQIISHENYLKSITSNNAIEARAARIKAYEDSIEEKKRQDAEIQNYIDRNRGRDLTTSMSNVVGTVSNVVGAVPNAINAARSYITPNQPVNKTYAERHKEYMDRYREYTIKNGEQPSTTLIKVWKVDLGFKIGGGAFELIDKHQMAGNVGGGQERVLQGGRKIPAAPPEEGEAKPIGNPAAMAQDQANFLATNQATQAAQPVPPQLQPQQESFAFQASQDASQTPTFAPEEQVPLPRDPSGPKPVLPKPVLMPIVKAKSTYDKILEQQALLQNPRVQGIFRQQAMMRLQGLMMRSQQEAYRQTPEYKRMKERRRAIHSARFVTTKDKNSEYTAQKNRMAKVGVKQDYGSGSRTIDKAGRPVQIRTPLEQEQYLRAKNEEKWKKMQELNAGKTYDPVSGQWLQIKADRFATGGSVDSVPAMLSPGEFVLNRSAVKNIGRGPLEAMNSSGKVKGYANGGYVGGAAYLQNGGVATGSMDISSFTRSVDAFIVGVQQLVQMPKVFEISLNNMGVNVNLNGAELISKLPALMQSIIYEQIMKNMSQIVQNVKSNLSAGN